MKRLFVGLAASLAILAGCTHGVTHHPGLPAAKARPHGQLSAGTAKSHKIADKSLLRLGDVGRFSLYGGTADAGHVFAYHYRHGRLIERRDLGFGTVTNVGVMSMANDYAWAGPSGAPINTLALAKIMATGTGTTASAATDISLQTADSATPVTGTQTLSSAANAQAYKVVGTLNYTGTEAVTEWALLNSATLSASTGTPWTAGTATTGTATGTPYTASSSTVQGEQQLVFEDTTKSPAIYGLVLSNTTSAVTVPAWYKVTDGTAAGTTPANTDTLKIVPLMLDHMVFSAINVINGDSIQFTFTLSLPSGS